MRVGRMDPETLDSEWRANRRGADMAAVLEQASASAPEPIAPLPGLP